MALAWRWSFAASSGFFGGGSQRFNHCREIQLSPLTGRAVEQRARILRGCQVQSVASAFGDRIVEILPHQRELEEDRVVTRGHAIAHGLDQRTARRAVL